MMWEVGFINETVAQNAIFAIWLTSREKKRLKLTTCLFFRWLTLALTACLAYLFYILTVGHSFPLPTSLSVDHGEDRWSINLYDTIMEDVRAQPKMEEI